VADRPGRLGPDTERVRPTFFFFSFFFLARFSSRTHIIRRSVVIAPTETYRYNADLLMLRPPRLPVSSTVHRFTVDYDSGELIQSLFKSLLADLDATECTRDGLALVSTPHIEPLYRYYG